MVNSVLPFHEASVVIPLGEMSGVRSDGQLELAGVPFAAQFFFHGLPVDHDLTGGLKFDQARQMPDGQVGGVGPDRGGQGGGVRPDRVDQGAVVLGLLNVDAALAQCRTHAAPPAGCAQPGPAMSASTSVACTPGSWESISLARAALGPAARGCHVGAIRASVVRLSSPLAGSSAQARVSASIHLRWSVNQAVKCWASRL